MIWQQQHHVWIRNRLDIIEDKEDTSITPILVEWALNYQIHPEYTTEKHWIVIFRQPFLRVYNFSAQWSLPPACYQNKKRKIIWFRAQNWSHLQKCTFSSDNRHFTGPQRYHIKLYSKGNLSKILPLFRQFLTTLQVGIVCHFAEPTILPTQNIHRLTPPVLPLFIKILADFMALLSLCSDKHGLITQDNLQNVIKV